MKDENKFVGEKIQYWQTKFMLCALQFFGERGAWTGHPYQGKINHRHLEYDTFFSGRVEDDKYIPPMMTTMLAYEDGSQAMDALSSISLMPYEVKLLADVEKANRPLNYLQRKLQTHASMTISNVDDEDFSEFAEGVILDRYMDDVSCASFKRLLSIFGYKFCNSVMDETIVPDDYKLTLGDYCKFWLLFRDVNLKTMDGFKQFLEDFNLHWLYKVKEGCNQHVSIHIRDLGTCLRALTSFRIGTPDGQHRWCLMGYLITGYPHPNNDIPIGYMEWREKKNWRGNFDGDLLYTGSQMFNPIDMHVIQPDFTDVQFMEKLRTLGRHKTSAAGMAIPTSYSSLISGFYAKFRQMVPTNANGFEDYTFENTLLQGKKYKVIHGNLEILYDMIGIFFDNDPSLRTFVTGNCKSTWKKIISHNSSIFTDMGYCGVIDKDHGKKHCPNMYGLFIQLVQTLCHNKRDFNRYNAFVNGGISKCIQYAETDIYQNTFKQFNWHWNYFINPLWAVVHGEYDAKLKYEACLLRSIRSLNCEEAIRLIASADYRNLENLHVQLPARPTNKYPTEDALNGPPSTTTRNKLIFSAYRICMLDVIDTILQYGWNPVLKHDELPGNNYLQFYVK